MLWRGLSFTKNRRPAVAISVWTTKHKDKERDELRQAIRDLLTYTMPMTPVTIIDNAKRLLEKA